MIKDANLPSMEWYAQTVMSLLIDCVSGGVAYLIGLRSRRISQHAIFTQVAGWIAIVAVILMMFYVLQAEWRDWMMGGVAELAPF